MSGIDELKEDKALAEVGELFSQLKEIIHRLLTIDEKEGFLLDEQYDKMFADANDYDDMHTDVMHRNRKKTSKSEEPEKPNMYLSSDEDEGDDDLFIKTTVRKRAKDFFAELF